MHHEGGAQNILEHIHGALQHMLRGEGTLKTTKVNKGVGGGSKLMKIIAVDCQIIA